MASDLGTIFGSGGLVISIISMIYAAINHKRIRAKCCGRNMDFEINIDPTDTKESKDESKEESPKEITREKPKKSAKVAPEPVRHPKPRFWAHDDEDADKEHDDEDADKELDEDDIEMGKGKH